MAAAARWKRMSLLINDGAAFLFSAVDHSAKVARPPPSCAAFTRAAVGEQHVALHSADGEVHIYPVTLAISGKDVVQLPGVIRDDCLHFAQVAAGARFAVTLRCDGVILVCEGERLTSLTISEGAVGFLIAAWGDANGILNDGILQIISPNDVGLCDLPDLEDNVKFTEIAAG
ncbi:unnamed protein product [Prorocentrum cordatum]|uniref:Uncharacterized protein n=1 Tax=Prorocentrum cordatum TaxID=2364126 RepID=A0ABN9YFB4_9DINO|nr:unnamed protein product [Polarella glacialis]